MVEIQRFYNQNDILGRHRPQTAGSDIAFQKLRRLLTKTLANETPFDTVIAGAYACSLKTFSGG